MERRRSISPVLALAVGIGSWIVASPAAMADEPARQPAAAVQVQQTAAGLQSQQPFSQAGQTQKCTEAQQAAARIKLTGSNILRPAADCTLPLRMLDRDYIDQSGATTPSQLLRSVPQAQGSR
jgi:hypothetical protein